MLKTNYITFTPLNKFVSEILDPPCPSSSLIPKWYKNLPININGSKTPKYIDSTESYDHTMKKCGGK